MEKGSIAHLIPSADRSETGTSKTAGIRFHREPQAENLMPGLSAEGASEWDTMSTFYGTTSPAEVKEQMFSFIDAVARGELIVQKTKKAKP